MSMQTAVGAETARALTIDSLLRAVSAVSSRTHADAAQLLLTAALGALELGQGQLAVDILRQAQIEVAKCTSR